MPAPVNLVDELRGTVAAAAQHRFPGSEHDSFPDFDDNLRQAFRQETELFFDSVVREDRSVLDVHSIGLHVSQ